MDDGRRRRKMWLIFLVYCISSLLAVNSYECPIEGEVSITDGRSDQVPFKTVTVLSLNFCALSCLTNTLCRLSNYKMEGNVCELLKKEQTLNINNADGWKVLQITHDSRALCDNNPCKANQICFTYCSSELKTLAHCHDFPNIAPTSILTYRSSIGAPRNMENVNDGDVNTLGHSKNDLVPFWMKLDFIVTVHIKEIKIHNREDDYSKHLVGFQLISSIVDQPLEDFDLIAVLNDDLTQTFSFNKEARFIALAKFEPCKFHIYEVEVLV